MFYSRTETISSIKSEVIRESLENIRRMLSDSVAHLKGKKKAKIYEEFDCLVRKMNSMSPKDIKLEKINHFKEICRKTMRVGHPKVKKTLYSVAMVSTIIVPSAACAAALVFAPAVTVPLVVSAAVTAPIMASNFMIGKFSVGKFMDKFEKLHHNCFYNQCINAEFDKILEEIKENSDEPINSKLMGVIETTGNHFNGYRQRNHRGPISNFFPANSGDGTFKKDESRKIPTLGKIKA